MASLKISLLLFTLLWALGLHAAPAAHTHLHSRHKHFHGLRSAAGSASSAIEPNVVRATEQLLDERSAPQVSEEPESRRENKYRDMLLRRQAKTRSMVDGTLSSLHYDV